MVAVNGDGTPSATPSLLETTRNPKGTAACSLGARPWLTPSLLRLLRDVSSWRAVGSDPVLALMPVCPGLPLRTCVLCRVPCGNLDFIGGGLILTALAQYGGRLGDLLSGPHLGTPQSAMGPCSAEFIPPSKTQHLPFLSRSKFPLIV